MTLQRAWLLHCDEPGCHRDALAEVHGHDEAVAAAQASGWTVRRNPADARKWQHFCPWHTPTKIEVPVNAQVASVPASNL